MTRVISSPSISTTVPATLIFDNCFSLVTLFARPVFARWVLLAGPSHLLRDGLLAPDQTIRYLTGTGQLSRRQDISALNARGEIACLHG
jgi:hypothetical protein